MSDDRGDGPTDSPDEGEPQEIGGVPTAIWATRRGEPAHAREAFRRWISMDRRSTRDLAEECGVSRSTIYKWARKYEWEKRADAYDRSVRFHIADSLHNRIGPDGQVIEPRASIATTIETMREIFEELAADVLAGLKNGTLEVEDKDKIAFTERYGNAIVKYEATVLAAQHGKAPDESQPNLKEFTDDEIDQLRVLQEKAGLRKVG